MFTVRCEPYHLLTTRNLAYRAPELFRGQLPTTKADIYSLAITLGTLKTQEAPYQGENNFMVVYQVVSQ